MGLFRNPFGRRDANDKINFIKELAKLHLRKNPIMAASLGLDNNFLDSLSPSQVMATPEAIIVSIVETWSLLKKEGVPEE
jgi:hypothetical protein